MKNGWYILNYHDISWEENEFIRGIGGSFSPKEFREHIALLQQHFRIMGVQQAYELFKTNTINEPIISFWFDDGFIGNRKYALPLLEKIGVSAAISLNSRFLLREELFWRFKLSYIHFSDGDRFLRSRFRKRNILINEPLKDLTFTHFSSELLADIDAVYQEMTTEEIRSDAFRIFDNEEGIHELQKKGWLISNHSAGHYPISENTYIHKLENQFLECERVLETHFGIKNQFWVLPFDRKPSSKIKDLQKSKEKHFVHVGNKINKNNFNDNTLYRIEVANLFGEELIHHLENIELIK